MDIISFDTYMFCFDIFSIGLAILSYILITVQGSINYMFKNYKTRNLIAERLLYEQFSYEVYESINSYPYSLSGEGSCYESEIRNMILEVKSKFYYDCRDVYDPELNENKCQNQIVEGSTCCKSECCSKTNGDETFCNNYLFSFDSEAIDKIKNNRILYYNDEEYFEDPRRRFCSFYNVFASDNYNLKNIVSDSPNLHRSIYNYKDIYLSDSLPMYIGKNKLSDSDKDCGIVDTKRNHLYSTNGESCPINGINSSKKLEASSGDSEREIIIRNILSEIIPDVHEWKENFMSLMHYEDKKSKEYDNLKDKILKTRCKDFINMVYDSNIYNKRPISVNAQDYSSSYPKVNLSLYTTNYIGFESKNDLKNFIDNFNENDPTDNLLYRLGKEIYPSIETAICGSFLIVLCIIYLIIISYFHFKSKTHYLWLFIVKQSILSVIFLILLGIYIWKGLAFKKIDIDMDSNFKIILNLYNKRRSQQRLFLGLIFLFISTIIPFGHFLIYGFKRKQPQNQNNQNQRRNSPHSRNHNQNQLQERVIPYESQNTLKHSEIKTLNEKDNDNEIDNN